MIIIMVFLLDNKNYDEGLQNAVRRMCDNNVRLRNKCQREMLKWKMQKGRPKSVRHMRLLNKAMEKQYEELQIDMAIQLLNIRMYQFVRWFSYMYGKMPKLCLATHRRLKEKYPYTTTGYGRCICIINI